MPLLSSSAARGPDDGSCTEKTPDACIATGGVYQGDGSTCDAGCPFAFYSNTIDPMTSVALAGSGLAIGDDLTLEGDPLARDLTYLDLRVYGNGGGDFDVTVELWDACPGDGGMVIPNTTFTWTGVPDDGYVYTLQVDPLSPPVTIPDTVWMVATFSNASAGWIIAEQAETGSTADLYARNAPPWTCTATFATHYAGLWANLHCVAAGGKSRGRADEASRLQMIRLEGEASPTLSPANSEFGIRSSE